MIKSGSSRTLLDFIKAPLTEEVPEGWYTTAQLMEKTGLERRSLNMLLNKEKRERKKFYAKTESGRRSVEHYYVPELTTKTYRKKKT